MLSRKKISLLQTPLAISAILCLATLLRLYNIDEWSLWEDEEIAIYFSQNLEKPFPSFFPLFFLLLNKIYMFSGVSIGVGRFLAAFFGIVSVWFIYYGFRKFLSHNVSLFASFLLTINLGHIFWSQSVRYYSAVYMLQLFSLYFFLKGFEEDKLRNFFFSSLFLLLATMTHSSAILIVPVCILYLAVLIAIKEKHHGYSLRNYTFYALFLFLGLSFFIWKSITVHETMSAIVIPSAMDPVHILMTVIAYFGLPVIALGILAPFFVSEEKKRIILFLFISSFLPIVELIIISANTSVTWYHAFIALNGFTLLCCYTIVSIHQKGWRKISIFLAMTTTLYYIIFLFSYYTTSHGARPLWKEAADYIQKSVQVDIHSGNYPEIFATAPGVVAYYLGVSPADTMDHPLVKRLLFQPPEEKQIHDRWILIKSNYITNEYADWLEKKCTIKKRLDSTIGPFDRWSILVYHCPLSD